MIRATCERAMGSHAWLSMTSHAFTTQEMTALYERYGDGAGDAFEALYRRGRIAEDPNGRLLVDLPSTTSPLHLQNFVAIACRRRAWNQHRSATSDARRLERYLTSETPPSPSADPQVLYEERTLSEPAQLLLAALGDADARSAILCAQLGYSLREVAAATGVSYAALRQRLSRRRRQLARSNGEVQ